MNCRSAQGEMAMPRCDQNGAGQAGVCPRLAGFTGTHRLSGLTVFSRPDGDRAVVGVCGELDLTLDHQFPHAPRPGSAASDDSTSHCQLDLDGAEFCVCSGVDLLLIIKREGLGPREPVQDGSAPDHDEIPSQGPDATDRGTDHQRDHDADLRLELDQLRRAMRSRGTIDLARGILMAAFGLSQDDAWKVLVSTSQHTNTKLRSVAEQVVDSAGGTPLPASVRKQLSAAVAEAHGTSANAQAQAQPQA
ncbi:ANTAR domain-containing protein [Streptomyces sp. NPDC006691]|uniref:ANTAR domain-containing protein n=1 Tax=Streptomyces sp. NPDC006691 TaxID=3364757 RepID=UPI0036B4A3F8